MTMASLLGIHVTLQIGADTPAPAPLAVSEALESIQVTHKDEGQSGFQLVFQVGRGALDRSDYPLLAEDRIKPFSRALVTAHFGLDRVPLMDGIITTQQLAPGDDPGTSKLTVTGEDVTVMMDLKKEARPHPQESADEIVTRILDSYRSAFRLTSDVTTPEQVERPTTEEKTPTQPRTVTDLAYIKQLAEDHGFVFYVEPGTIPGTNVAYWGPPKRSDEAQPALAVAMGSHTNVESITFKYSELTPKQMTYVRADGTEETIEQPSEDALADRRPNARVVDFLTRPDGLSDDQARVRAQAAVNRSYDEVATAEGTLDALRYGRILRPRSVVDIRGAGEHHSGSYYVKQVVHKIDVRAGKYEQSFSLRRDGVGTKRRLVQT